MYLGLQTVPSLERSPYSDCLLKRGSTVHVAWNAPKIKPLIVTLSTCLQWLIITYTWRRYQGNKWLPKILIELLSYTRTTQHEIGKQLIDQWSHWLAFCQPPSRVTHMHMYSCVQHCILWTKWPVNAVRLNLSTILTVQSILITIARSHAQCCLQSPRTAGGAQSQACTQTCGRERQDEQASFL